MLEFQIYCFSIKIGNLFNFLTKLPLIDTVFRDIPFYLKKKSSIVAYFKNKMW